MSLATILDLERDVKPYFALACCDADDDLLRLLRKTVESQARAYVGHCISQNTITNEYQRRDDLFGYSSFNAYSGGAGAVDGLEIQGNKAYFNYPAVTDANVLQLDNGFVRSISDLRLDLNAMFGQQAGDFATGTSLSLGTDFYLELDRDGLSKSGRVLRRYMTWPSRAGTVRITYVAGLTKAELDGEWAFVKQALLEEMQLRFNAARSQRSAGGGPVAKESYVGDYTVEYDTRIGQRTMQDLSAGARMKLWPIKRVVL